MDNQNAAVKPVRRSFPKTVWDECSVQPVSGTGIGVTANASIGREKRSAAALYPGYAHGLFAGGPPVAGASRRNITDREQGI